jgi:hypothetical protein
MPERARRRKMLYKSNLEGIRFEDCRIWWDTLEMHPGTHQELITGRPRIKLERAENQKLDGLRPVRFARPEIRDAIDKLMPKLAGSTPEPGYKWYYPRVKVYREEIPSGGHYTRLFFDIDDID